MADDNKIIPPGSTIGILGGGQLGRMISSAAIRMGYHTCIYSDVKNAPAFEAATDYMVGAYDDVKKIREFANKIDVATIEFENIPNETLNIIDDIKPTRPDSKTLGIANYRVAEKLFFDKFLIPTAQWWKVRDSDDLVLMRRLKPETILKMARSGYDGKGQYTIDEKCELPEFYDEAILEEKVNYEKEISVIIARKQDGSLHYYPPMHNVHRDHILYSTLAPAIIDAKIAEKAVQIAKKIAESLDLVGMVAVEMFIYDGDKLYVNEIAPRPHNSGHWTMDGANICQFELLIRAICNLPIPPLRIIKPVRMLNLLGDDAEKWQEYLKDETAKLYLYGKGEIREKRKMGHVNFVKTGK